MKILHLEDSPVDAELTRAIVAQEVAGSHLHTVADRASYLAALQRGDFDVILSDYTLPDFDGLEALTLAREHAPDIPFVFCSGSIGEDRAIAALQAGAADYVLKDRLTRLGPVLRRVLQEAAERRARVEAEKSLRLSHERFDLAARATNDVLWDWDIPSDRVWWNEAFHQLFGHDVDERTGTAAFWLEHIHPDDVARIDTGLRLALDHGRASWSDEYRFQRADGSYADVLDRGFIQRDATGRAVRMLGSMQDITARKAAEAGLRDREARLRAIIDNEPACVKLVGPDGALLDMNPAGLAMLEAESLEQVKGRSIYDHIPKKAEREGYEGLIRRVFQGDSGRRVFTVTTLRGRRRILESHVSPMRDADGRILAALALTHDITDRRKDEAKLRQQADIIERAPVAIFMADLDHRVTYSNAGAAALCGLDPGEMLGRRVDEIFPRRAVERLAAGRQEALRTGQWHGEVPLETREGRRLVADFILSLVRDETGQPAGYLQIATDITEKKQLEEQIHRAQRLENLGLLAAGIAHDLNNVLSPVLMAAPLLRTRINHPSDLRILDAVEKSAERGSSLVRQILSFARGAEVEKKLLQPKHVLREVADLVTDTFPRIIRPEIHIPSELWTVQANPTQLHQVVLNLCINARDAMPTGGTLTLRARNEHFAAAAPERPAGPYLVLEIADTGSGMTPAVLEHIWEPFFTTKGEGRGTGLGLSTVRGIVADHHGHIEVESSPGFGSTFRVYLPAVVEEPAPHASGSAHPFEARGRGERILVIDDDAAVRELVTQVLADSGYQPLPAADGADLLERYAMQIKEASLILMDVDLPDQSGVSLARILQRARPDLRVLFMSGFTDSSVLKSHTPSAGAPLLKKPFTREQLLRTVQEALVAPVSRC